MGLPTPWKYKAPSWQGRPTLLGPLEKHSYFFYIPYLPLVLPGGQQTSQGSTWLSLTFLMCQPLEACCFMSNSLPWATEKVRNYLHLFQPQYFFFSFESIFFPAFLFFFSQRSNVTARGGRRTVCSVLWILVMLVCFPSCPSLLSSGIFLQATVPRPMRRAGFCIVILVCECAISSLVTEQERAGNKITVNVHFQRPVNWFHWHFKDHFDSHGNTGQSASRFSSLRHA